MESFSKNNKEMQQFSQQVNEAINGIHSNYDMFYDRLSGEVEVIAEQQLKNRFAKYEKVYSDFSSFFNSDDLQTRMN